MIRPRGEEGGRGEKLGCRLHLVGMGQGVSTVFKYPFVRSTWIRRSSCTGKGPKWLKEESLFGTLERGVNVRARRDAPILHSPVAHLCSSSLTRRSHCLTLGHQAHLLERHEVGEYQGELGADFTSSTAKLQDSLTSLNSPNIFLCYQTHSPVLSPAQQCTKPQILQLWLGVRFTRSHSAFRN